MNHNSGDKGENKEKLHRLLERQIRRATEGDTLDHESFFSAINDVYKEFDLVRERQERALKLVSEEMEEKNRETEKANQAKSEFLANMSHELRTPMNSIIGLVQILLTEEGLRKEHRDMLEVVKKSSDNLLSLVNDVLDLSKIEADQLTLEHIPFDFYKIGERVNDTMVPLASDKGLNFQINIVPESGLPKLMGDPLRITRILINLVGNAVKYTAEGGVTLNIECEKNADHTVNIQMNVIDTGIGIPQDKVEFVFGKFVQADTSTTRQFGGTGLGLSITRQLVELMQGEIYVESTEGEGSDFGVRFNLPLATQADLDAAEDQNDASEINVEISENRVPVSDLRVLVAEDHAMNQVYIKKLFQNLRINHYHIAENGEEVIKQLDLAPYDLILMDCHMPKMNGYDTTTAIRKREESTDQHIPIIAMTANAMIGDREKCLECGMDDYICKPVDMKILKAILSRWIEFDD